MDLTANQQLRLAVVAGDYTACEAAFTRGATDFDWALYEAARGGHRDLCELAAQFAQQNANWGATNFDEMLHEAAYGGHRDLCELAKSWGATDFNEMLHEATHGGHRDLCELAKSWGATDFNRMLHEATYGGHHDIENLAKYWHACAINSSLPAWISLFGLLVVTDGYFVLKCASPAHVRWVKILSQLPLELQAVVCFRCHGLVHEPVVTQKAIDEGGQWLFPAGDTPASPQ